MGYLYLFFALVGGLGKGFLGKNISNDVNNFKDCIILNIMRMFFCAVIGMILILVSENTACLRIDTSDAEICILSAICMTAFCVSWMYAYKTEAYMFLSVFTMLGSVITCFLGLIFLNEPVSVNQWAGMAILAAAIVVMLNYNKYQSGSLTLKGVIILIVGCIGSAGADFCQKIYMMKDNVSPGAFNFYTYLLGFLMLIAILAFIPKSGGRSNSSFFGRRHILLCMMISACLYLNSLSKTFAAGTLSSAQIYPVLQGANLICSAVLARILLNEKINRKSVAGMTCAFAGLMVMKGII